MWNSDANERRGGIRRFLRRLTSSSRGLRGRFILLISALLITTAMALGWIFLVREVRDEGSKLAQKSMLLAKNLAGRVELGVFTRNRDALAAQVDDVLRDPEAAFVIILGEDGHSLYAAARRGWPLPRVTSLFGPESEAPTEAASLAGAVRLYREPVGREEFYVARVSVLTQKQRSVGEEIGFIPDAAAEGGKGRESIGNVFVGLSTRGMREDVRRLEKALGIATLAVIAVGILLTVPLVRIIADPVNQLAEATRRIAVGDMDILLRLDSQDEIGDLARSFNQMTLRLQNSREELERTNLQLEQKVQERTRELEEAQSQLVQAEKMSVVGQLVSGIAHELNNPLAGVLGYSQLLLRMPVAEEVQRGLEKIEAEAERCKRIVQNLLLFARRDKPQKRPVDINSVVESVLELTEYKLRVDGVQVVRDLQPALPRTFADAGQLQQVIMNIVHNAQQAMRGSGNPSVLTVRSRRQDSSVKLEIEDSGPGIPPEILSRIFDPFFTTKEVGQGTGLGLSICYGIVHEHRGRIWAESRPGRGSTFHIEIPIAAEGGAVRSLEALPPSALEARTPVKGLEPARILVVDDEASIVDILYDVLRLDGHHIETAINGRLALVKLQERPFDVVISDLKMPGMSGQELFRHLQRLDSTLAGRVIFTTGDVASPETQGFLNLSGSPYLQKPFDLNEVRKLVQQVLEGARQARADLPSLSPAGPRDPDRDA